MNNINFELYKYFYYVASEKNLTRASQRLFISQPAITQSIKKLEEKIGYSLFYRTKHGMELTEAGSILYDYLKYPIECVIKAQGKLDDELNKENKVIRIGAGNTLVKNNVINPLKEFKAKYPNVKVEIIDGATSDLLKLMENNLLDIVILNMPVDNNTFNIEIIEKVQDAFIASSKFIEYKDRIFSFKDLNTLPLVLQKSSSNSKRFLEKLCKKYNVELNSDYELLTYSLVLDFVKSGLAIGFINKNHIKKELQNGELYELNINFEIPPREIGIAINPKIKNNIIIQEFIEYLKNEKY